MRKEISVRDIGVGRWWNFGLIGGQDGPTQLKDESTFVTGIRFMATPFSNGIVAIYTTNEMGKEEFFEEFPAGFRVVLGGSE